MEWNGMEWNGVSTLLFEEDFLERLQAFEEASGRRVFHFIRVKKMLED